MRMAMPCAKTATPVGGSPLMFDQASVELGEDPRAGVLIWFVDIPEQKVIKPNGVALTVDENTGRCTELKGRE